MWRNNVYNLWYFASFCNVLLQNQFFCKLRCFLAKSVFLRFTRFCVEKNLAKNCTRGEKMTNMRYGSGYLGVCKYLCLCELSICVFVWTQYWVFVFVWAQCWMFVLVFVWSEYLGVCEYLCLCGLSIWVSTIERAVSPPAHSVLLREIYPENPE